MEDSVLFLIALVASFFFCFGNVLVRKSFLPICVDSLSLFLLLCQMIGFSKWKQLFVASECVCLLKTVLQCCTFT